MRDCLFGCYNMPYRQRDKRERERTRHSTSFDITNLIQKKRSMRFAHSPDVFATHLPAARSFQLGCNSKAASVSRFHAARCECSPVTVAHSTLGRFSAKGYVANTTRPTQKIFVVRSCTKETRGIRFWALHQQSSLAFCQRSTQCLIQNHI